MSLNGNILIPEIIWTPASKRSAARVAPLERKEILYLLSYFRPPPASVAQLGGHLASDIVGAPPTALERSEGRRRNIKF